MDTELITISNKRDMRKNAKIYIAGHNGLVGSSIWRLLKKNGFTNLVGKTSSELDLRDQIEVRSFFNKEKPDYVIIAAAKVGGILANNKYRADFIYDNLQIQCNLLNQCYANNVKKVLFLGSSCIYPKDCPQPIKSDYLLSGELEYTNEPYAIAKIAGIKLAESLNIQHGTNIISVMPTNLFGPNDNYNLESSHVLPAFIRKMHLAKCLEERNFNEISSDLNSNPITNNINYDPKWDENEILNVLNEIGIVEEINETNEVGVILRLWGSGKPRREFLYIDDVAEACLHIMENVDFSDICDQIGSYNEIKEIRNTQVNIGSGKDIRIDELSILIKEVVGFKGKIEFNNTKPDGTMQKLLDVSMINSLGWKYKTSLKEGIYLAYNSYLKNLK
jgi:GDP-L-fucose synthase